MGTSHRHTATIKGEPNWGNASKALTSVASGVEESDNLTNNPPPTMSPRQIGRRQSTLGKRISNGEHRAVRNLVRAAGGRAKVSSGSSRAIGYAGIAVANKFVSTIVEISDKGLNGWLKSKGVLSLEGKSCRDIVDCIRGFIEVDVAGLDNTAANEALEHIMDMLELEMSTSERSYDEVMTNILTEDSIKDMLDEFFGMYIFSHLSQNFSEKIGYEKGTEVKNATMEDIKDQIIEDVRSSRTVRPIELIDWKSTEGETFIKKEFDRIIFILSGNED